jgi:hypothetical protein
VELAGADSSGDTLERVATRSASALRPATSAARMSLVASACPIAKAPDSRLSLPANIR